MKIEKQVTEEISNISDKAAIKIVINDFNEDDNAVFTSLFDSENKLIVNNRVYTFNNLPCDSLTICENKIIKNENPDGEWSVEGIKLWLNLNDIEYKEVEGKGLIK